MMDKEMLSASDVAARLGVTASSVYKMIAAGQLPHVRIGRRVRLPLAAWEAWIASQTTLALEAAKKEGSHAKNNAGV